MSQDRWLLPEGIEEVLPPRALRLEALRRALVDLYAAWGYDLIMPPFIEYLDSLLTGTGNDLDLQTFKFIDQLSGRLLGVRADMTPQAARIDAHQLKREHPVRLCYLGTVLRTRPDGFARSRSPLQVGAELYGHAGVESDIEIIGLMLATLKLTGVRDVHIDLGHVGIYRALVRDAGLDSEQERALFDALQRKARAEIDALLDGLNMPVPLRAALGKLADLNGSVEVLNNAEQVLGGLSTDISDALARLRQASAALARLAPEVVVHIDLAELRGYHYHTGLVFAAFVPGHGEAIAQGGRYDDIGRAFGRARPATGFSTDLKTLLMLGVEDTPATVRGIFAPCVADPGLQAKVASLRAAGQRVICALPGQVGGAHEMGCDHILDKTAEGWQVVAVN